MNNPEPLITISMGRQKWRLKTSCCTGRQELDRVKHEAPRPPVQRGCGHSVIFKYLAVLSSQIALVKSLAVTLDI